jgi:folate-binding protein YgfZ
MTNDEIAGQVRAARRGALIQAGGQTGTLAVTGRDRKSWLNGLVTCDLAPLSAGQGAFGLHVGKTGKIQAELWIVLGPDRVLAGVPRAMAAALRDTLDHYLIMEDAEITDASAEHGWLFVHGPLAADLVDVARAEGALAARVDRTGLGGAAVVAPAGELAAVEAALLARAGDRGALATPEGYAQLTLELGLGQMGVDYDEQSYPQEAALEGLAVSFNKGCYLGQETVFMLQVRGHVKKRLVRLDVDGDGDIAAGAEITAPDGASIGAVTRAGAEIDTGRAIALGHVKYKHIEPGTEVRVAGRVARVTGAAGGSARGA